MKVRLMPRLTKARAKERLQAALDAIPELKQLPPGSPEFKTWGRDTRVAIENTFEEPGSRVEEFSSTSFIPLVFNVLSDNERNERDAYTSGLESAAAILESMVHEIEEYRDDDNQEPDSPVAPDTPVRTNTNQVFVIHGHDHGARDTVARFLGDLGLEAVILQEQPDQGRTVIEKFEQYAQCDFAVALFTPDDVGGPHDDDLQPRARQNVIFEFGYFIGKFGRDRVCALVKADPEIPTDYSGVLYIPLDEAGAWKFQLMREMKSAGFDIDANLAFQTVTNKC